jgi:hypothetical protein
MHLQSVSLECGGGRFGLRDTVLYDARDSRMVRGFGDLARIVVASGVRCIGRYCFAACASLRSVVFAPVSGVRRIEEFAFAYTAVRRIRIPASVETIEGTALIGLRSLVVARGNTNFLFRKSILYDRAQRRLVRSYGAAESVVVSRDVEIIGRYSFIGTKTLTSVSFEEGSTLRQIEELAFFKSCLREIRIPATVEVIGRLCFAQCRSLESFAIEEGSRLLRIEGAAFENSAIPRIEIPPTVVFIGEHSIPSRCLIVVPECIDEMALWRDSYLENPASVYLRGEPPRRAQSC